MELPSVASLEFEQLKASIKNYIKTKSDFTDFDFEGSNLSMLVDILAYNTLYTSYNINMASNELNLDTAVLRDNIVSHAKKLGYNPISYQSSKVVVDLTCSNVGGYKRLGLKSGATLQTSMSGKNYTYVSKDPINLTIVPGASQAVFRDVELVEGTVFDINYTVNTSNEHQRFFIPNNFVDSTTVKVFVKDDASATTSTEYTRKNTIVGVKPSDTVFFVEEVQDQKYEVIFGDDVIGRKLQNGEVVTIRYIVTAGSELNNVKESSLQFIGTIEYVDASDNTGKLPLSDVSFTLNDQNSSGGSSFESISSIKYRAPRYYAAQERAVTISDYESLIMQLYGNTDLVKVVGGETLYPPQFGKVFITIKPKVGDVVSSTEKLNIVKDLKDYIVGSITPVIVDPKRIKITVKPVIVYNKDKTRRSAAALAKLIRDLLIDYENSDAFKNFIGRFSKSELLAAIQNLDASILYTNVKTKVCAEIDLQSSTTPIDYSGSFFTKMKSKLDGKYAIVSGYFCYPGYADPVFIGVPSQLEGCVLDNNIYIFDKNGNIIDTIGTIDFDTGEFSFSIPACSDDDINLCGLQDGTDLETDSETYPDIIIDDPVILDDDDDDSELDDDTSIGEPDIGDVTGDPDITSPTTVVDDPNNVITIDDFTPETDPSKCN